MTIGDFIDGLAIANIRIWHLEDLKREYHDDKIGLSEKEVKDLLSKISNTNRERNILIDKINASIGVLVDKAAKKDSEFSVTAEILLGTGKNKFYKGG